ncbi:Histidine triad nucleotide-binding protein 3 [Phytophthora citrophthora]|uniref:Histidine triad nucleotide-binding protein 3 n=1 Tax=Phytophthora citrophthora TaxID=4793 RepID=A0AAD9GUD3_9STRA|nr:Histidine triad nucleotide-binding protein 3 [Phytophthora citrophthora]
MLTVMSVSGAPRRNTNNPPKKERRLRKRLRACLPRFHATEPKTEAADTQRENESPSVKIPGRLSEPTPSRSADLVDTNHSWSDTEDMSPVSIKPRSVRKRRQHSASPCSSPSSVSSSSSSSTSSTFSVSHKGVKYGHDGALVHCRFCEILQSGDEPFLYEDEDVVVFRPLAPVVVSHILVVPRRHIRNVNKLTPDDTALLRHMHEVAASVLREMPRPPVVLSPPKVERVHDTTEEDCTDDDNFESDFKFAFHSPPFNSIDHVHMHAFRTRDGRFGCVGSIKYRTATWWCRSFDEVMARLGFRKQRENGIESSTKTKQHRRHAASHPPCGSTNGSMVLTSVESLG